MATNYLKNTLNNPLTVTYDGECIRLSPKAKVKIDNPNKLGSLPKGIALLKGKDK